VVVVVVVVGQFIPGSARMYLFDNSLGAPDLARLIGSCHKVPVTRSRYRSRDHCPRYLPISYSHKAHHDKSLDSTSTQVIFHFFRESQDFARHHAK